MSEEQQNTTKKRSRISDVIRGRFLVNEGSLKNWRFVLYLSFLALLSIASAHSADKKVRKISRLNQEIKELSSEYIEIHSALMTEKMESEVIKKAEELGLEVPKTPPTKLIAKK